MIKRNDMKRLLLIVLWACLNLSSAQAFEVTTHGAITQEAWARFLATDPDVLKKNQKGVALFVCKNNSTLTRMALT